MFGLGTLARVARELHCDVQAVRERDPAARGVTSAEILATWPGVHALLCAPRRPRAARRRHAGRPARDVDGRARGHRHRDPSRPRRSARGFFVDHGAGVVVGETAEIGDDVTLYQGVTLGGTGFATGKRHPTLEANVTVGSGREAARPDHDRPRREDRRELGRHPRRAAEQHGRRQPGPPGAGRGPSGPRAPTPTGSTCPTRSPTRSRTSRARIARLEEQSGRSERRRAPAAPGPRAEPRRRLTRRVRLRVRRRLAPLPAALSAWSNSAPSVIQFARAADAAPRASPVAARAMIAWCWATERRPGAACGTGTRPGAAAASAGASDAGDLAVAATRDEDARGSARRPRRPPARRARAARRRTPRCRACSAATSCGVEPRHRELGRQAVDRGEQRDHLVHVARASASAHARVALRRHLDEPLVAQAAQRVAHRGAAERRARRTARRRAAPRPARASRPRSRRAARS